MLEILFYALAVLIPLLIPFALVAWLMLRSTKRTVAEHQKILTALRDSVSGMSRRLGHLEQEVTLLRSAGVEGTPAVGPAPEVREVPAAAPARPIEKATIAMPREPAAVHGRVWPAATAPEPAPAAVRAPAAPPPEAVPTWSYWEKLSRRFLENWTGILGSVVLVAGIGFIGSYAAMRVTPAIRFLLVLGAGCALFLAYFPLHRHERWQAMALWLRSSGAAVFLFACAASGGLPNLGLMWITNPTLALVVLLVGVAGNLALAWVAGREAFASLHVILSLVPMAILPQIPVTLAIATAVAAMGVLLTYGRAWDRHLLLTVLGYAAFHAWWVTRQAGGIPLAGNLPALACVSAALVFVPGALAPYRRRDTTDARPSDLVIVNHLLCWGLLAAALFVHLADVEILNGSVSGLCLVAAGGAAFLASARARRRGIAWLRTSDLLIAQGLILGAVFTWRSLIGDPEMVAAVVYLETLLFRRVAIGESGKLAGRIGVYLSHAAALGFTVAGLAAMATGLGAAEAWQLAALMFAGACATVLAGAHLVQRHGDRVNGLDCYGFLGREEVTALRLTGPLAGFMTGVALLVLMRQDLFGLTALSLGCAFLYGSGQIRGAGLASGAWLVMAVGAVLSWYIAATLDWDQTVRQSAQLMPMTALPVLAFWLAPATRTQTWYRRAAIYLLGVHLGVSAYLLLAPVSALAPTVTWLVLSLLALESAERLDQPYGSTVLQLGFGYVAAFLAGYVLVVLPAQSYLGPIRARFAIELFGLAALVYWWLTEISGRLAETATWRLVHPYFFELVLALSAFTVFSEVPLAWRPVAWVGIAAILLSPLVRGIASRASFYSLAAFYTSVAGLAINVSSTATPSPAWYDQPGGVGLIAVAAQIAYLTGSRGRLRLTEARFQPGLRRLQELCGRIEPRQAAVMFYPFFAGLALFFSWQFDRALLTFLWAAEAFAVFVLSIVLREGHFRTVALAGLAVCLLRLVVYDLAQANLFFRGLVFIGVGALMLAMNAVYNKYRTRIPGA